MGRGVDVLLWSLHSMADVRAARTEEKIGHSGRDDITKRREREEHRLKPMLQEGRYLPALRRSFGVASQISSPLGGTMRFSSMRAAPDFFREVMWWLEPSEVAIRSSK